MAPPAAKDGNLTISSFFSPVRKDKADSSISTHKRSIRTTSEQNAVDLTVESGDSDGETSSKRRKLDADGSKEPARPPHKGSRPRFVPPPQPSATEKLSQWLFSEPSQAAADDGGPSQSANGKVAPTQRSAEDEERHAAFRGKLLGSVSLSRDLRYLSETTNRPDADAEWQRELDREPSAGAHGDNDAPNAAGGSDDGGSDSGTDVEDKGEGSSKINLEKFAAPSAGKSQAARSGSTSSATSKKATSSAKGKGKAKAKEVGPSGKTYTPLEEQIIELKQKYPGVLLIVEVGYKFRFFGEDARVASRHLNVACFPDRNFLSAMIPVHRLNVHIRTLISAGYKVGVVRQTETRALKAASDNSSGPFSRDVTGVYTASTWVDDLATDEGISSGDGTDNLANHSLVAVVEQATEDSSGERVTIGIVSVQVSTGQVIWDQFEDTRMRSELETRLAHCSPIEILVPPKGRLSKLTERIIKYTAGRGTSDGRSIRMERRQEENERSATYNEALNLVTDTIQAGKQTDERTKSAMLSIVLALPKLALLSYAACVSHLKSFGLDALFQRAFNFSSFASRSTMLLTANTLENLEVFRNGTDSREKGSLFWLIDRAQTAMGKRLLRAWLAQPLTDLKALRERTAAVDEVADKSSSSATLSKALGLLKGLPDLEKGLARLSYGRSSPSELAKILLALSRVTTEFEVTSAASVQLSSTLLKEVIFSLSEARDVCQKALSSISIVAARDDNKIDLFPDPESFPALQDVKDLLSVNETEFRDHLSEIRRQLKRPSLQYATVAEKEYLVEVRKADANKVPTSWIRINSTTTMVRFHTPHIIKLKQQRDQYKETLEHEASIAYNSFIHGLMRHFVALRNVIVSLAKLDAINSLARLSILPGYCRAELLESSASSANSLELTEFRHPMSEALYTATYVPNSIALGSDSGSAKGVLLTGSNMGGKSSTVRAIALCVIMAQCGAYVPASSARLTLHDSVLTRMGASDDLAKGRSTFRVEVEETAEILRAATGRSLVVLDELGRGTSTNDGTAVAYAVLRDLMSRPVARCPTTLFITHYFSLGSVASLPELGGRLVNMHMAYAEQVDPVTGRQGIVFLYRLRKGLASSSFGIHCAALAGLPEPLLAEAERQAMRLEAEASAKLERRRTKRIAQVAAALSGDADLSDERLRELSVYM